MQNAVDVLSKFRSDPDLAEFGEVACAIQKFKAAQSLGARGSSLEISQRTDTGLKVHIQSEKTAAMRVFFGSSLLTRNPRFMISSLFQWSPTQTHQGLTRFPGQRRWRPRRRAAADPPPHSRNDCRAGGAQQG